MKTKTTVPLLFLPALIQPGLASKSLPPNAFISSLPSDSVPSPLHASKSDRGKKKKNASPNKGVGFGSKSLSSNDSKSVGNVIYPDLEPQVIETLVPAPNDGHNEGGVLSEDMYDRLEDIYGFSKFNFGGIGAIYKSIRIVNTKMIAGGVTGESAKLPSLFDDILSGGSTTQDVDDILLPSITSPLLSIENDAAIQSQSFYSSSFDLNSISPCEKFRVLHTDPMILAIDDFFTMNECDKYIQMSIDAEKNQQKHDQKPAENNLQPMLLGQSQTMGKDSRSKAQRTSTTWFHYYEGAPELMAKASRLLGLEGIERWEEPQTVRYRRNEKFTWHLDALSPEDVTSTGGAGQRVATLLVYLTELSTEDGGATMFRDLGGDSDGPLKV